MWFWFFLMSLFLNIFFLFYVRWLLKSVEAINEDMISLTDILSDFSNHISSIYELELFYGDETLQGLLTHSKDVVSTISEMDLLLNENIKENLKDLDEKKEK